MRTLKKLKLTALSPGPVQHAGLLTYDLIKRIRAYKAILGAADQVSIDEAVDGFCRDRNPEKEVEIWERIAHIFQHFTEGPKITDGARRREVLRLLLLMSTSSLVYESLTLTRDQINELLYNF